MDNRRHHITLSLRSSIINLHEAHVSIGDIPRQLSIHRTTVHRWIRRQRERGNLPILTRSRRPQCTTVEEDHRIIEAARQTPLTTAVAIKREHGLQLDAQTIRNRLHEDKIFHHIPAKKPLMAEKHKEERLGFALQYYSVADDFWKKVIFCDKTFSTDEHSSLHCWRPVNTR
ncbi:uncharacterized protein LOC135221216 [Macrobrachium nipponense]|uniref:uncharacterized protein LOC135221216 n=1 Tax=Macrobrachium nipponense TaxID=159736 RepID=UPI0030C88EAB